MANIKVSDMTALTSLPDDAIFYVVLPDGSYGSVTKVELLSGIVGGSQNIDEVLFVGDTATDRQIVLDSSDVNGSKATLTPNYFEIRDKATNEALSFNNGIILKENENGGYYGINLSEAASSVPPSEQRNLKAPILTTDETIATQEYVASELASEITKCSFITITQAVNLDEIETRVNELDAAVILKGTWSASSGSFPSGAQAGWSYLVTSNGTIDGIEFSSGDRLICVLDNASTTTYAGNWYKADYTDRVNTVAGRTGNVVITSSDLSDFNSAVNALITSALASFKTSNFLDFTSSGQTQLNAKQDNAKLISANYTALNNDNLIINATCTITDVASPSNGTNFNCTIVSGSVTIGGVVYTQVGSKVTRIYNSGAWQTFVDTQIIDYSLLSTIVGFSSFTTRSIFIVLKNGIGTCFYDLAGVSNSATKSFTLDRNVIVGIVKTDVSIVNNSGSLTSGGRVVINPSSNVADFKINAIGTSFTASGNARLVGQFDFIY